MCSSRNDDICFGDPGSVGSISRLPNITGATARGWTGASSSQSQRSNLAGCHADVCTPQNQPCPSGSPPCCNRRICVVQDVLNPEKAAPACIRASLACRLPLFPCLPAAPLPLHRQCVQGAVKPLFPGPVQTVCLCRLRTVTFRLSGYTLALTLPSSDCASSQCTLALMTMQLQGVEQQEMSAQMTTLAVLVAPARRVATELPVSACSVRSSLLSTLISDVPSSHPYL